MAKYVRVVRTEMEGDSLAEVFTKSCSEYPDCRRCPMYDARNTSYKKYGKDAPSCIMRFLKRPKYWLKKFGWEGENDLTTEIIKIAKTSIERKDALRTFVELCGRNSCPSCPIYHKFGDALPDCCSHFLNDPDYWTKELWLGGRR